MADAYAELIRLAAQMVRCQSMPQIDAWNWPRGATQRLRREAVQAEETAQEQCRQWALAIKEIADALPAQQPAQGEAALLTPALAREWLAYEGEDRGPTGFEAAIRAIAEHAPPAPSVPEDTARDAARYRHIRDSIGGGRLVEDFAYSDLDAALDAGIAAAAAAQR